MSRFLDYVERDGAVQRANPLAKLFFAVALCAAVFISGQIPVLITLGLICIVYGIVAHIPRETFHALFGLLIMSIVLFILQPLFVRSGNTLFYLGALNITDEGLIIAARVALTVIIACLAFAQLLHVTRVNDLACALVKNCGLPYRYAFTFQTALRFVPLFSDEMESIMEAQRARGVEFDTRNPIRKLGLMLPLCVPLLVGCVKKSDSTAIAAQLRGFELRGRRSGYKSYSVSGIDVLIICCGIALIAGSIAARVLL